MMSLNMYPISKLVFMWNLLGTCIIQGTKFRPRFLVADLESLQSSCKIIVSLKSYSGDKSRGQRSGGPVKNFKRGQVKMAGGVLGLEQGQGKEHQASESVFKVSLVKVSFKVLFILSTCPKLWGQYAQWSFQSVPNVYASS